MPETDFPDFYGSQKQRVDDALERILPDGSTSELVDAMRYSVLGGGKRLRGVLVLETRRTGLGEPDDTGPGDRLAGVVELIHAYSLVHDDLPAMDDDDMRRGQPACHVEYGEDIAILCGNALLNLAYETINEIDDPKILNPAFDRVSWAAGYSQLLDGQYRDLRYETRKPSPDEVLEMYTRKTGALIGLSLELGAISAGLDLERRKAFRNIGTNLGVAFQIRDDLLELEGGEKLGKNTDSDRDSEKWTYARLVGEQEARDRARTLTRTSRRELETLDLETERISELAEFLIKRSY